MRPAQQALWAAEVRRLLCSAEPLTSLGKARRQCCCGLCSILCPSGGEKLVAKAHQVSTGLPELSGYGLASSFLRWAPLMWVCGLLPSRPFYLTNLCTPLASSCPSRACPWQAWGVLRLWSLSLSLPLLSSSSLAFYPLSCSYPARPFSSWAPDRPTPIYPVLVGALWSLDLGSGDLWKYPWAPRQLWPAAACISQPHCLVDTFWLLILVAQVTYQNQDVKGTGVNKC